MIFLKHPAKETYFLTTFILFILLTLVSFESQAIHISAFRIYLDDNQRQSTFTLSNSETISQECNLFLRHYNYDEQGKIVRYEGEKPQENSAKDWLRFSPKHFILTPTNSQKVRFKLRRKAKAQSGEYRSFLVVDCGAKNVETEEHLINIKPKLIHNVPIIARIGNLKVDVMFSDIIVNNNVVNFKLNRQGNRSIYGDIELINKKTEQKIAYQKGLSIYPESSHSNFSLSTQGINPKELQLRFIENTNFGGDKVITQDLPD
ncbi:MAG: hypothetical protein GY787_06270 [Alteromonadales bacterium]|nr:hypothetical protein [Alteromonadales bacterium]